MASSNLRSRIESAIHVAKRWEEDVSLFAEIRASIPMTNIVPELVCDNKVRWKCYLKKYATVARANEACEKKEGEQQLLPNDDDDDVYEESSIYSRDDDALWEGDDLLLKRLTLYFKQEVMTWCNQPPCCNSNCKGNEDGKRMESRGIRGPQTEDEITGGANRVEVYACQLCKMETTFPRYNSPRILFQSRRGRCGEFANLFGTYCRALGFDTRYILDFTDHVWVEVWSMRQQRWIHADPCEGLIDRPNMYEQGWGKELSYVIGATNDSVVDVTRRYTRKFFTSDFQARRRMFAPDERTSHGVVVQLRNTLAQKNSIVKNRMEELNKRVQAEEKYFDWVQSSGVWDIEYREGRISGSLAWKAARHELGNGKCVVGQENHAGGREKEASFLVESFHPPGNQKDLTISVQSPVASNAQSYLQCITVNGVACAAAITCGIAIVVVDETSGCILHSKSFSSWVVAGNFLDNIHSGRIIALCSIQETENSVGGIRESGGNDEATKKFKRLGGFNIGASTASTTRFVLFVGQLNCHPDWATNICSDNEQKIRVVLQCDNSRVKLKLRPEMNTVPAAISHRLPDLYMSLNSQITASNTVKRVAFNKFVQESRNNFSIAGYTTKPGAPVYLIDNKSYPFGRSNDQPMHGAAHACDPQWITYHFLPESIVPDDNEVIDETETMHTIGSVTPKFDVPIADDYFVGLLGNQLIVKSSSSVPSFLDTSLALSNSRLTGLYFSAHFCGPCRGFTPLLIEFYNYLQEIVPTHGLKIVFISSDQDEEQFQVYYDAMPFLALPFSRQSFALHAKSVFGVRGIPSLVIIDSMSGKIVKSPDDSRRSVQGACQQGGAAIERLFNYWLDQVPDETKAMLHVLALSCQEDEALINSKRRNGLDDKVEKYLFRKSAQATKQEDGNSVDTTKDVSTRVKEIFFDFVATGMDPNSAAAEAIKQITTEQNKSSCVSQFEASELVGTSSVVVSEGVKHGTYDLSKADVINILTIAKRYLTNVLKDPSNPRFRCFRLGNKVFDQISSIPSGVAFLTDLGFSAFHADDDFVASIPLSVDLAMMNNVFESILSENDFVKLNK